MHRRQLLKHFFLTATAFSAKRIQGANERLSVALLGCGSRGRYVGRFFRILPEVDVAAVCDVYPPQMNAAREQLQLECPAIGDFRKILDRKDVDAVLVATPDHWHATITILACQAGKDVYVEKPLGHHIREGRVMVAAARKYKRIVQTGTQHRSAAHYREAARIVQSGELGKVHFVRVWNYNNAYPRGVGRVEDSDPPPGLDWDMYLGPAPLVPFNRNRFLGTFRWFWDYAGGFITDWGTHRFDSVHQVMGIDTPRTVTAMGSRFELNDGAETPDILQATYEFPGFILSYESCQLNGHGTGGRTPGKRYYRARGTDDRPHGEAFYGTNGTLFSDRIGFEIYPEMEPNGRAAGGKPTFRMAAKDIVGEDATDLHARNFVACVRSRRAPVADVAIGHRASIVAHLGNIAYRTGRKLRWDATEETILNDKEASALLERQPRHKWDLVKEARRED